MGVLKNMWVFSAIILLCLVASASAKDASDGKDKSFSIKDAQLPIDIKNDDVDSDNEIIEDILDLEASDNHDEMKQVSNSTNATDFDFLDTMENDSAKDLILDFEDTDVMIQGGDTSDGDTNIETKSEYVDNDEIIEGIDILTNSADIESNDQLIPKDDTIEDIDLPVLPEKTSDMKADDHMYSKNDTIENIDLQDPGYSGCFVELFQHSNYRGHRTVYRGNVPRVRYNDRMSSLKVPKGCCVTIYEHVNYRGRRRRYCGKNVVFVGRFWNDRMSSLKLSGRPVVSHPVAKYTSLGCYHDRSSRAIAGPKVNFKPPSTAIYRCYQRALSLGNQYFAVQYNYECFTHRDAGKTYAKYGRTIGCRYGRGGSWKQNVYRINAPVSSPSGCYVELFQHSRFRGHRTVYRGNVPRLRYNDRMSSLKVPKGCCVTIYEHIYYRGNKRTYCEQNVVYVGSYWNDRVSSLKVTKKQTVTPPTTGTCGKPDHFNTYVIGGVDARRGAWPWQILLKYRGQPMCGGSLISSQWVVTAAHCVSGRETSGQFSVRIGEHDWTKTEGSEKDVAVSKVISHPQWSRTTINNDIALLKLQTPVQFNKYVKPVCLPEKDVPVGTECYITGWGKIKHPGAMFTRLQQAVLPVVTNHACQIKNKRAITGAMICGGDGGVTTRSGCHGDSGGPYVCKVKGVWELHGAVSWGSSVCSSSHMYTVFARVTHFIHWIKATMAHN